MERLWLWVKRGLDVYDEQIRTSLAALRDAVAARVCQVSVDQVRRLTGYGYIRSALDHAW